MFSPRVFLCLIQNFFLSFGMNFPLTIETRITAS